MRSWGDGGEGCKPFENGPFAGAGPKSSFGGRGDDFFMMCARPATIRSATEDANGDDFAS